MSGGERPPEESPPPERVGRGRSRPRLSAMAMFRILLLLVGLIAILVMRRPCAEGVGRIFDTVAPAPDAGPRRIPSAPGEPTPPPSSPPRQGP